MIAGEKDRRSTRTAGRVGRPAPGPSLRPMRSLRAFALGMSALLAVPSTAGAEADCFRPDAPGRLSFEILQQAHPPPLRARAYRYDPLTAAVTMNTDSLHVEIRPGVTKNLFLWANRCDPKESGGACGWNPKGNLTYPRLSADGREVRTFFSSFRRANDCTLLQAAVALGADAEATQKYRESGNAVLVRSSAEVAPTQPGRLIDTCLVETRPLPKDVQSVMLDYEVQDGRTPDQTLAFLKEFAALVHSTGRQVALFTNPLDAPTQAYTGVGPANAAELHRLYDRMSIFLWHRNRQNDMLASARSQIGVIAGGGPVDPKKLFAVFELNNTDRADAARMRQWVLDEGLAGIMPWRNRAVVGGSCATRPNQVLGCLAYGTCGS